MYQSLIKPIIDFLFSLAALLFFLPLLIVLTTMLIIVNNGKPFFLQTRPGKNGKPFDVVKFKTMTEARDESGYLLPDSKRITKTGKFIRNTSLDEIPQLLNVLKGDMSFVGPRPLLTEYLPLYNKEQLRRHDVKPGITGWAQVNGRNAINWQKKFEYDVWYVDNLSFALDFKILLMTIKKVLISEGINQAGQATAEAFKGNN